jgi:Domain of unknown function (DUF4331)
MVTRLRSVLTKTAFACGIAFMALGFTSAIHPAKIQASDHDDGDIDVRSRALSLTDLYVFREQDQNSSAAADDLILVMNTNPRSLARQQYFFSTEARYEFKIARVNNLDGTPTGSPDMTIRVTFGAAHSSTRRQPMTITLLEKGKQPVVINRTQSNRPIVTTPLISANDPVTNAIEIKGRGVSVFAGLREDPFYFDVEQFFRVRAGLLGRGPSVGFRTADKALDFAKGYNVNTIVMRVPRRLLQSGTQATTFDTWLTISVQDPRTKEFVQTEQLARPGINEALLFTQGNLAAFNRSQPSRSVPPRVAAEVTKVLLALGNSQERATALIGAFVPDVMRIDTTGTSGFANALNSKGSPVRGRMLEDDVVDIALSVLTNGAVTTDNVSYDGVAGNPAQGHAPLESAFPYLALPN